MSLFNYDTVDTVVADFDKAVKKLVAVANREQKQAQDKRAESERLAAGADAADREAERAMRIADRIGDLLS